MSPDADSSKQAMELGWNWFKYHAEQRMLMIRYYLIIIGVVLTAYSAALKDFPLVSAAVALFALVTSVLFWALDRRVSTLIKLGENVLGKEQEKLKLRLGYEEILITQLANSSSRGIFGSYSRTFKALFLTMIVLSVIGTSAATMQSLTPKTNHIGKPN